MSRRARRAAEQGEALEARRAEPVPPEPTLAPQPSFAPGLAPEPRFASVPPVQGDDLPELVDGDDWFELPEYARPASAAVLEAGAPAAPGVGPVPFSQPTDALATPVSPLVPPPAVPDAPAPVTPLSAAPVPTSPAPGAALPGPAVPGAPAPGVAAGGLDDVRPPVLAPPGLMPPDLAPPALTVPGPAPDGPGLVTFAPSPRPSALPLTPVPVRPPDAPTTNGLAAAPPVVPPIAPSPGLFPGLATIPPEAPGPLPLPEPPASSRPTPRRSGPDGPTTSSIPVIRPPVQVRRPEDDHSDLTAETRSLRVTPPDAKALFRTSLTAKGSDPGGMDGPPGTPGTVVPAANTTPPTPAEAPPRPVAPKIQLRLEDDAETGEMRRAVVIGTGPGSAPWAHPAPPDAAKAPPPPPASVPAPARKAPRGGPALPAIGAPAGAPSRPEPGRDLSDWLGELRDDEPAGGLPPSWNDGFGTDQAAVAATVVPARGRQARQNRKAATKATTAEAKEAERLRRVEAKEAEKLRKSQAKAARKAGREVRSVVDELPPTPAFEAEHFPDADDLEDTERGRLLSLLVFWAPALILLLLAGVVIWLVR